MLLITPISPNFKGLKCSVFGRFRALQSRKNYGTMCVIQVAAQRSPAMRICMSFVYFCIPLAGVFIAAEAILSLYRNIRAKKEEAEE